MNEIPFERSFASHEKSKYWSSKNNISPRDVYKGSNKVKYLFDCPCGHEFKNYVNSISAGKWCLYCAKPSKKMCENKNCNICFNKSFAINEKSKYWSNKNELKPEEVFLTSNTKYWFNCSCGHEFESNLSNISKGAWCPYCCNPQQKICNKKDCKSCFEKSFASHEKSQYWSEKNQLNPREVFKSSDKKYFLNCKKNHTFEIALSKVINGRWCPVCKNKTEEKLFEILKVDYPDVKHQFRADWCKNPITNKYLPFDFLLHQEKIIIELDGAQHFKQVSNWTSPEEQYERDTYKMECANQNNYSVIRITQEDVYDDTFDWYTSLKESIQTIIENKSIENHFISYNDDYKNFD
jgi:very-short-patch-repair endonuclease